MEAWLNQAVPQFLGSFSLWGYVLVFVAGIITSIGPCNLSTIPVIIGYVAGTEAGKRKSFVMSLLFTLGTAVTFMALGLIIAAAGGIFGISRSILYYIVAAVCIAIGLNLIGVWKLNLNFGGNLLTRAGEQRGYTGSFVLGLVMGLVGSQCGTPILLAILSLALASGKWVYGATLLFVYALGRGVPIVAIGTFTGLVARMEQFARWNAALERIAGWVIVLVGGYFFWIA